MANSHSMRLLILSAREVNHTGRGRQNLTDIIDSWGIPVISTRLRLYIDQIQWLEGAIFAEAKGRSIVIPIRSSKMKPNLWIYPSNDASLSSNYKSHDVSQRFGWNLLSSFFVSFFISFTSSYSSQNFPSSKSNFALPFRS